MERTETTIEYAAFVKKENGKWFKIHPFTFKSEKSAMDCIDRFKTPNDTREYKIAIRTVTITQSEWEDRSIGI